MCGIIGAINGNAVIDCLMTGLERLEYRGYDSAGVATIRNKRINRHVAEGKLKNLRGLLKKKKLDSSIGIAHTRWATHGSPTARNAHPHVTGKVAVVHNGIIENYQTLRRELEAMGHRFESETDTEVIPQLITSLLNQGASAEEATRRALQKIQGAYALGILFSDIQDRMIAACNGSPLVLGIGEEGNFIASDSLALVGMAKETIRLEDGDWALVGNSAIEIRGENGALVKRETCKISTSTNTASKGKFRHYMKKEIHEQPRVIRETLETHLDPILSQVLAPNLTQEFERVSHLKIIACGTSYHAGMVAKYWLEKYAGLSVDVDTASEFRYRDPILSKDCVSLFISQSGETADTLAALRFAKSQGQKTFAIVNAAESTMAREADLFIHTKAGPEIGVASTKAFTTQLSALACLTISVGDARGFITGKKREELCSDLARLPDIISALIRDDEPCRKVARDIMAAKSALFVGRGTAFPIAVEGALKLKEISYIHAEAYSAGELKHGPIALVDPTIPIIVVAPNDHLFEKTLSNLQEISARGGRIYLLSDEQGIKSVGDHAVRGLSLPDCAPFIAPIVYSVPLQMIAYHVAYMKGTDIDQPRNLAKSVTVE